jgi:hypothetical protein
MGDPTASQGAGDAAPPATRPPVARPRESARSDATPLSLSRCVIRPPLLTAAPVRGVSGPRPPAPTPTPTPASPATGAEPTASGAGSARTGRVTPRPAGLVSAPAEGDRHSMEVPPGGRPPWGVPAVVAVVVAGDSTVFAATAVTVGVKDVPAMAPTPRAVPVGLPDSMAAYDMGPPALLDAGKNGSTDAAMPTCGCMPPAAKAWAPPVRAPPDGSTWADDWLRGSVGLPAPAPPPAVAIMAAERSPARSGVENLPGAARAPSADADAGRCMGARGGDMGTTLAGGAGAPKPIPNNGSEGGAAGRMAALPWPAERELPGVQPPAPPRYDDGSRRLNESAASAVGRCARV